MTERHRAAWQWAAFALVVGCAAVLRLSALQYTYEHPDEIITVGVASHLLQWGTLDTNWHHVELLPPWFRYPQYNFSAYMLASAAALQLREWWPGGAVLDVLSWLRAFSALLGAACVAGTFLLARHWFGAVTGLVAAALVAVHPLLVQDALYARPETFVTLLTLVLIGLLAGRPPLRAERAFGAAVVLGVLVATKVSMLLLLPLLVLALDPHDRRPAVPGATPLGATERAYAWARAYPMPAGLLAGFVLGAPYALVHFADFLDGVRVLRTQYGTYHWPHGTPDGGYLERVAYALRYFNATTGVWLVVATIGAAVAAWRRQWRPLAAFLVALGTVVQFAGYPVFFERNLSHVVPLLCVFAALALVTLARLVRARWLQAVLLLVCTAAVAGPSVRTTWRLYADELSGVSQQRLLAERHRVERHFGLTTTIIPWTEDRALIRKMIAHTCGPVLVQMPTVRNGAARALLDELARVDGLTEVARHLSRFEHVPPSTLHTYFTPTTVFLHRGADADFCWRNGGGTVPVTMVGDRLPVRAIDAGEGWTRGGAYGVRTDPFGDGDYFGSWSGRDTHRGRLRIELDVSEADFVVIPLRTGPSEVHHALRLSDADNGQVLLYLPVPPSTTWLLPAVRVPARTQRLAVEVIDMGASWGDWVAVGMPRGLR